MGLWEQVVLLSASDFGRTLSSNGLGTDHGWGGNNFLIGGGLSGGKVLGSYPNATQLGKGGALNIGRGRVIPTTSWEAVWHAGTFSLGTVQLYRVYAFIVHV